MGPWGPFFSESLIFNPTAHFLQDFHFKWHFKSFPHSNALATYVDPAVKLVKVITGWVIYSSVRDLLIINYSCVQLLIYPCNIQK